VLLSLLLVAMLGACAAGGEVAPLPTRTPTATVAPTTTVLWFPPTATRPPVVPPTVAPTSDFRPGLGEIVLAEDFSSKTGWQTLRNVTGSVAFGKNELTIALGQNKGSMASLATALKPLTDFYLDITVNTSLCRTGDVYGLLVRASSAQDFYRILISCDGKLRAERISNGKVAILQDWTTSSQVRPGAPQFFRLGVWAFQGELRVFINDAFQFSVNDLVLRSGTLGIFGRTPGEGALTVSFSRLEVRSLNVKATSTSLPPVSTPTGRRTTPTRR